jgi:hypothetical protein
LSVNGDGTVTLRCDADAFFAHADEIRRLLAGTGRARRRRASAHRRAATCAGPSDEDEQALARAFLAPVLSPPRRATHRDLSAHGAAALAAGYFLTRVRGQEAFTREDVARVLAAAGVAVAATTLTHLCRRGWLVRARRGAYALSVRALERVEDLRRTGHRPRPAAARPPAPRTPGLSRFLREVPASRKWRRVLLVAYFLREHCGVAEFDQALLRAAFRRARGVDAPGALGGLISQILCRRHGLVERGAARGSYRLTERALADLRANPRVAHADAVQRAQAGTSLAS